MSIIVLDPTGRGEADAPRPAGAPGGAGAPTAALAPPLASLEGRLVGVLDNGKANADRLLRHAEQLLRDEHGVRAFIRRRKPDFSRPAPPALLAELRACDALITAVGD
jgi:hypothetical protein